MRKIEIFFNKIFKIYQDFHDNMSEKIGVIWLFTIVAVITVIATKLALIIRQYCPWIIVDTMDEDFFQPWMVLPGLAHAIIAGGQIVKVSTQKSNIINAKNLAKIGYKEEAKKIFIMNAFIRINIFNKGILFITSLVFYFQFITYPYSSDDTLIKAVSTTVFIMYGLWACAVELDDEFHGIYRTSVKEAEELIGKEEFKMLCKK